MSQFESNRWADHPGGVKGDQPGASAGSAQPPVYSFLLLAPCRGARALLCVTGGGSLTLAHLRFDFQVPGPYCYRRSGLLCSHATAINPFDGVSMEDKTIEKKEQQLVEVELVIEELEAKIAPKLATNHNETLVKDK